MQEIPAAATLTPAPLRNRLRVALSAPVARVWALIGDLARFPEYSAGLERVDPVIGAQGRLTAYVCHFRPRTESEAGIVHRETIRWHAEGLGYASSGEPNNAFGLRDDLSLVTVQATPAGTLLTWDVYFESSAVSASQAAYDEAFEDIAQRLIARFGGKIAERFARSHTPGSGAVDTVVRLSDAINRGDLDAAALLYAADAVLIAQPGTVATGREQIREALRGFMALRPTLGASANRILETADTALYLGRWQLLGSGPDGSVLTMRGDSTDVLRRDENGPWQIVVDNPWGAALLSTTPAPFGQLPDAALRG